MDRIEKIHHDVRSRLGDNFLSKSIAQELVTFSFLVGSNSVDDDESQGQSFFYHRESGMTALLLVLILVVLVETAALHLLISMFSHLLAWLATLSSLYVAIVIVAQVRAIRCRPIRISNGRLYLCNGIVNLGDYSIESVESVATASHKDDTESEILSVCFPSSPNVVIQFKDQQEATILFGQTKTFQTANIFVDRPDNFNEAMRLASDQSVRID